MTDQFWWGVKPILLLGNITPLTPYYIPNYILILPSYNIKHNMYTLLLPNKVLVDLEVRCERLHGL